MRSVKYRFKIQNSFSFGTKRNKARVQMRKDEFEK